MTDRQKNRRTSVLRAYWSQADPVVPRPRAPYRRATPMWPTPMIEPTESELARWSELWSYPQAAGWDGAEQRTAVATLVRAEHRCMRKHPSALAEFEVDRLRSQLGLNAD